MVSLVRIFSSFKSFLLTYFFCQKGNSKYEAEGPKFHMGFPREYQVCHKSENDISDMGAPTYWRLSRLQTQMTSEGTKDTTQEPEVTIEFFRTCNVLLFSCTHLALWRVKDPR